MTSQRCDAHDDGTTMECDVCGVLKRSGPQRFELFKSFTYDIFVCANCRDTNGDGWARHLEDEVLVRLRAGVPRWLPGFSAA
jgi:hypothetical protein